MLPRSIIYRASFLPVHDKSKFNPGNGKFPSREAPWPFDRWKVPADPLEVLLTIGGFFFFAPFLLLYFLSLLKTPFPFASQSVRRVS